MTEKKILAAAGAIGAACMGVSTMLMGFDLADGIAQNFKVTGFLFGAVGTFVTAGIAYYKGAMSTA